MKVLMILSRFDTTGMTTNTVDLANALSEMGNDVHLLVGTNKKHTNLEDYFLNKCEQGGVKIVECVRPESKSINQFLSAIDFLRHIAFGKYDIIHVESPYLSFMPWLLHKKFVSTFHVNDLVRCFYYKNATHLIAISKETKEYAKRVFGYNDSDITIVRHGVPVNFSQRISDKRKVEEKKKMRIPTDKVVIGLVGSVEKRKGHDILLNAISMFEDKFRNKIHVVFLGDAKNNNMDKWLDTVIKETNNSDLVTKLKYQNPEPLYKLFDIFVLPSRLEGFPMVVVEAMLSGCCCVRSNVEGATDQIDDGITGFLFENEDASHLANIIKDLLEHPQKRRSVAEAGREKALRDFTSETMARNTLDVYRKVVNEC